MKLRVLFALLAVEVAISGVALTAIAFPALAPPQVADARVAVGPTASSTPISPAFWGINMAATHPFTSAEVSLLSETPVRYLRFPGGITAEWMNYTSALIYNNTTGVPAPALTSVAQFVSSCQLLGCHAILQLPAEIDSPATAAYDVAYVEDTLHFRPAYWEIGNDPNLWTHFRTPWTQWATSVTGNATPVAFAELVHAYIAAIRPIDPTTPILALGSGDFNSNNIAWIRELMQIDGSEIAGISIHSYPAGHGPPSPSLGSFFDSLSGSFGVPSLLSVDREIIRSACVTCTATQVFLTEVSASYGKGTYGPFLSSFDGTLFIAAETLQGLDNRAANMDWFCLDCNFGGAWIGSSGQPLANYFLFRDVMSRLGPNVLPVATSGYGNLYSAATTGPGGGVELLVVNTNPSVELRLNVSGPWGSTAPPASGWFWDGTTPEPVPLSPSAGDTFLLAPLSLAILSYS
jgi:hypothetical protein